MRPRILLLALSLAAGAFPARIEAAEIVKLGPGSRVRMQDLLTKPDDTILESPSGKRHTVGDLRKMLAKPGTPGDLPTSDASLGAKLKEQLVSANAAAKAALATAKGNPMSKIHHDIPTPLPTRTTLQFNRELAGKLPCDRRLLTVENVGANFQIQPGQEILLNGCFAGAPNAEVRISGEFPPYGYLVPTILERGDSYFYVQVPNVTGVPDQSISVSIHFFDGVTTNSRSGFFYATRAVFVSNQSEICPAFHVTSDDSSGDVATGFYSFGCEANRGVWHSSGHDTWTLKKADKGFRVTGLWWLAWSPTSVSAHASGGSAVISWHAPEDFVAYSVQKVRVEGPAGVNPF